MNLNLLLKLAFAATVYMRFVRPRVLNWGATPDEIAHAMPGDDVLDSVDLQTTRALTVAARPEHIWPWLAQMGPRPRGGVYTYDWIERLLGLDIVNADHVLPEFQKIEAGQYIALNAKQGLKVLEARPNEALVLQWEPAGAIWTFALFAEDGNTRLISRNSIPGSGIIFWLGMVGVMEVGSLVMERKMLLGIKERAEKLAREI